jgi:hypothetical protein
MSDAYELLESGVAANARKAAKLLIKSPNPGCCDSLVKSLSNFIKSDQHWKTTCDLIQAIGGCKCTASTEQLRALCFSPIDHSMIVYEAARALIRISDSDEAGLGIVKEVVQKGCYSAIEGALDAIARYGMKPSLADIKYLIEHCRDFGADRDKRGLSDPRYGLVVACYQYPYDPVIKIFLTHCSTTGDPPVQYAAQKSAEGEYIKMR